MSPTDGGIPVVRETPDSDFLSPRLSPGQALDQVALIGNNFGDGQVFRDVLGDWFAFMGGKPGQVIIVDNGSPKDTQAAIYAAYCEGMIDKLVLVRPGHADTGNHQVYIGEHTSPAIATKPYLLWFHIDTLPFRQGHEEWLAEAISYLDRNDVFAVGGSYNFNCKHHAAWPGWYFSDKCSENFALMKRGEFVRAMEEFCGEYISSGFTGKNPVAATGQNRYLLEVAFERYIQAHQKYTLMREEDPTWTIFHTNVHGEGLGKVRTDYLARKRVTKFLNAGCSAAKPPGIYYGQPPVGAWLKRFRTQFGRSAVGPHWRAIKQLLAHKTRQ
ncbi:MAG: glycosyltransferase family A protein [Limisphaerales bacterium]